MEESAEFHGRVRRRRRGAEQQTFVDLDVVVAACCADDISGTSSVQLLLAAPLFHAGALLLPGALVTARGRLVPCQTGFVDSVVVETLSLERQAAEPRAVARVLDAVFHGQLSEPDAARFISATSSQLRDLLQLREAGRALRPALVAHAQHMLGTPHVPRQRPHKFTKNEEAILKNAELSAALLPLDAVRAAETADAALPDAVADISLPDDDPTLPSARGPRSRGEYAHGKKAPQVAWFVQRLATLPFQHVLDVGGGRGDLGRGIALAFAGAHVSVVDANEKSLAAGRARAAEQGLSDRISFICGDFADLKVLLGSHAGEPGGCEPPIDLVVALHACGGLTDAALGFACAKKVPFLVAPCCYGKYPELVPKEGWFAAAECCEEREVLCRLCESPSREVSRRAMVVVNSRRAQAATDYRCELAAFSPAFSLRNLVLQGLPQGRE